MILTAEILAIYQELCESQEVHHIEAKKAKETIGDSVMQTICAFANTTGGYLLLGVSEPDQTHDNFWVSGVSNQDNILSQIQTNCRNQFTSIIAIDMGIARIEGKTVIAIEVFELPSENKPCGFIGKGKKSKNYTKTGVWLRGANNDYEATVQELKPLMLAQAGVSYEEVILDGTTLDDIDPKHLERYRRLRGAIKPNASELEYNDGELLLALKAATEKAGVIYPNIAGLLLFGSDKALRRLMPMARVDYIRHAGTVWVESNDQRFLYTNDLREAIITMIPKLEANIIDDLPKRFELPPNALQRIDTPILPQEVIREAVVNMLMHRDYAVHQPSQINRFSDRIELTNAGYSLKPVEKIRDGVKGSQLRNPIIAQVLYDLNFAETKGTGIATMNNGLKKVGLNPAIFTSHRQHNESEAILRLQQLIDEADMTWLQQFSDIKDNEAEVLILAKQMPRITNKDIRKNVGIDMHQASTILRKFCKRGYLSKHGKSQNSYYILNDQHLTGISAPSTGISAPSTGISAPSTGISAPSTGISAPSTGISEAIVIDRLSDISNDWIDRLSSIAESARQKERLPPEQLMSIILQITQHHYLTSNLLAELLSRKTSTLRKRYLSKLVKDGYLTLAYPNTPTHKNQAYRTTSKGAAWLNAQTDKNPIN